MAPRWGGSMGSVPQSHEREVLWLLIHLHKEVAWEGSPLGAKGGTDKAFPQGKITSCLGSIHEGRMMDASPWGQVVFREAGRGHQETEQSQAHGIFGDQTVNPFGYREAPWGNCKEIRKAGNGATVDYVPSVRGSKTWKEPSFPEGELRVRESDTIIAKGKG